MSSESSPTRPPTTAHVLYLDVVGSGTLPMERQRAVYDELNQVVAGSPEFCRASQRGAVLSRPSGDGMALVFFEGVEGALLCALELADLLKSRPHLPLRIGIHTGEVYRVKDINGSDDVTGDGIVLAKRVMDCGDAGHILVSSTVVDAADRLPGWKEMLRYLGVCQVKHGHKVALWNLHTAEVGNPRIPSLMVDQIAEQTLTHSRASRFVPQHDVPIALIIVILLFAAPPAWTPLGALGPVFLLLSLALGLYLTISIRRRK